MPTNLADAARVDWDVVIVGAGPAGGLAAHELARRGARVLLVDKARFPRWKVCGCCLNGSAIAALDRVGLGNLLPQNGAAPLHHVRICTRTASATLSLPTGAALSRERLDSALVEAARAAGVIFLPQTEARCERRPVVAGRRFVSLSQGARNAIARTKVLLVADGLQGRVLRALPGFHARTRAQSRIGVGAALADGPEAITPGTIHLTCGKGGYVGAVRIEENRLNVAAALDRWWIQESGGIGNAVASLFAHASRSELDRLAAAQWRGTPALTRIAGRVAGDRWFLLGDSAGYVEPFTGEGIAWAFATARALTPFALQAVKQWHPGLADEWTRKRRQLLGSRQRTCRLVSEVLRIPWAVRTIVRALSWMPFLAAPLVRRLNNT